MSGFDRLQAGLARVRRGLLPPPKLSVSAWSDRHRVVSSYSAEPGPWVTDRTPYLREIMDSFTDPTVNEVVFMKCARIGGTEAGLNVVGYYIDQDPSPILIVQPTVDDAKDFSKEQLAPMIADTKPLQRKVRDPKARDSGNTVQAKVFEGGGMYLVGANSPRGFRRRTARVVILEEIDGYPISAGSEGDPLKLAERRAATFAERQKIYKNSTPTLKGESRIERAFERSDQRRYHVPCPECGAMQVLRWKQLQRHDLPSPMYGCEACGVLIGEEHKPGMLAAGEWVPTNPASRIRGYHLNALYSPWVSWDKLAEEWSEANEDPTKLQVFINTVLGETWEDRGEAIGPEGLARRREVYPDGHPDGVVVATAGIDVQADRIEVYVWGWGKGEECWLLAHEIVVGDTSILKTWDALDPAVFQHPVVGVGIDSGYANEMVLRWARPRLAKGVFALKGGSEYGKALVSRKPTVTNRNATRVWLVGTDTSKDLLYARLKIQQPGPGYVHLPDWTTDDTIGQLTAEVRKLVKAQGGYRKRWEMPRGQRREAADCARYAYVALQLANWSPVRLDRQAARTQAPTPEPEPEQPEVTSPAQHPKPIRRKKSWASNW